MGSFGRSIPIMAILIILVSCNQVRNKGEQLAEKSEELLEKGAQKAEELADRGIEEAKEVFRKAAFKTFEVVHSTLTYSEEASILKSYNDIDELIDEDLNGLKIQFPSLFYFYFFEYKADDQKIKDYISAIPTRLEDISTGAFVEIDGQEIKENLKWVDRYYPRIGNELDFFKVISSKPDMKFYKCARYPNLHYLAVDKREGIIYHHFEKYWD